VGEGKSIVSDYKILSGLDDQAQMFQRSSFFVDIQDVRGYAAFVGVREVYSLEIEMLLGGQVRLLDMETRLVE
jgi:hypothetical protein